MTLKHSSGGSESLSVESAGETEARRLRSLSDGEREVTLSWRDLSVRVGRRVPGEGGFWKRGRWEENQILSNVNGYTRSGSLMAIMGASGAGKTTLLATISQRLRHRHTGEMLVNGKPVSKELMVRISGFVPQHDLVVRTLTLLEHIEFMAKLMMDRRVHKHHRNRRISSLLFELGLSKSVHTRLSALSGGEMKRLSLAVQLLTDPPILFCDEPTTGLDSYSAGVVVEKLRQFAERGKAVICTIHQPASGLFDLFHHVFLLAGGRVAYTGLVSEASSYFNSVGLVCPVTYNPAEFYVQQLAVLPGKEMESHSKIQWLCDQFEQSARGKEIAEIVRDESCSDKAAYTTELSSLKGNWSSYSSSSSNGGQALEMQEPERDFSKYISILKPSHLTQLYWLSWRSYTDNMRNSADLILRFILFMFVAVLISTPYINITEELNQRAIQNLQGFLYLIITETVFTYSYSVFHTFPGEIPTLLREIGSGLYSAGPYYLSKMLITIPKAMVESFLFATFVFYIAGLRGGLAAYCVFIIPVIACAVTATAYGSLMSAAFKSVSTASLVSVPIEMLSVTFCGLFFSLNNLPAHLSWIKYLSQFYYGQEALSIVQWHQIKSIDCPDDPDLPCITDGEGVLNRYGYSKDNFSLDIWGLFSIYCVAHFMGFLAIWRRSKEQAVY